MFKLALRNITSKPFRAVATVLAIAVAVAMIFAMLSFSPAVYEYIYSTQTAISGRSDIVISTNSSSDRLIDNLTAPIEDLDNVEYVVPTLSLYAQLSDGEYVQVRGFKKDYAGYLQDIEAYAGNIDDINANEDNVVISKAMADRYGLELGSVIELSLGSQKNKRYFVAAIAKQGGYFLNDSPYLMIGRIEGFSRLLSGIQIRQICNEIYVKVADGADTDALIKEISSMPQYESMLVKRTDDSGYIQEQADSLSAPVVLSGAAVLALGVAVIVLLFMMSEGEKVSLISNYSIIGATKKQILAIFLTESIILACAGAIIGSALAVGIFVGILKLTLSSSIIFSISAWRLFGSAVLGLASAVISSLVPILRAFKGTIRQNQLNIKQPSRILKVLCPVLIALTAVSVAIEFAVPSATAVMAVVSLALALITLGVCVAPLLRITAKVGGKISNPSSKVASVNIRRDGRFARSVTMLGVGMTVSMMLFMAWSVTKSVFSDYVSSFADLVFVTNVQSTVDTDGFLITDAENKGNKVDFATKIVWQQGTLKGDGFDKTMNILGSKDALELVNFGYITDRAEVEGLLNINYSGAEYGEDNNPYVFLDNALTILYGVKIGDTFTLVLDGKSETVCVGGILEHKLFSGNYIVMSDELILKLYGVAPDTVVLKTTGDVSRIVNDLRAEFASNNYYVVDVLTAYKWDMQSSDAVFDLVGTLAIVVALFIFAVTVAAAMVGRGANERSRAALLNAGMSNRALLFTELLEHGLIALVSFVLSFAVSVLLTASLIHALRLFGLYFEFMYEAWVVATAGIVMGAGYTFVPIAFNFKKGYNIKKR